MRRHVAHPALPPRLAAIGPLRLTIAGHNSEALLAPPHAVALAPEVAGRIEVAGACENLGELYDRARVFAAPTRFGAGISLKVHEAMSRGVPCVVS
ncbi:MAG TPA: glycosyltransferase family 4 protein, partial [Myxococcota bacterium]